MPAAPQLPADYPEIREEWIGFLNAKDNVAAQKAYFEKIMPAIIPVIKARAGTIPKYDGVISLLGYTPETVVLTCRILRPKRLVALHTPETEAFLEMVSTYSGIPTGSFFHEPFQHGEGHLDDIYSALKLAIGRFNKGDKIAIELTGGKKTMGAQLSIAAGLIQQNADLAIDVCYIDYDQYLPLYRKPEPETTRLLLIKNPLATPYKIFGKIRGTALDSRQVIVNPIFRGRNFSLDPKFVLVLMPFNEDWSDRIWKNFILPLCEELGLQAVRADDLFGHDIVEDIWMGICMARIVIADVTNRNPNVFYELGIAHTMGKEVVLLAQNINDLPFDLNRYRCIVYKDNFDGYEILKARLKKKLKSIIH